MTSSKKDRCIRSMGTGWFVSYKYYLTIDKHHLNWKNVPKTISSRIAVFNSSREFHNDYIRSIIKSNPNWFNQTNKKIGLTGNEIIEMAIQIYEKNL